MLQSPHNPVPLGCKRGSVSFSPTAKHRPSREVFILQPPTCRGVWESGIFPGKQEIVEVWKRNPTERNGKGVQPTRSRRSCCFRGKTTGFELGPGRDRVPWSPLCWDGCVGAELQLGKGHPRSWLGGWWTRDPLSACKWCGRALPARQGELAGWQRAVCRSRLCAAHPWTPATLQSRATALGSLIYPHKSPQLSALFPLPWTRLLSYLHALFLCFFASLLTLATKRKKTKHKNHRGVEVVVKTRHEISLQ